MHCWDEKLYFQTESVPARLTGVEPLLCAAMLDVCVIGHLTKDRIKTENAEKEMPGGTAHHFSMAVKHLAQVFQC